MVGGFQGKDGEELTGKNVGLIGIENQMTGLGIRWRSWDHHLLIVGRTVALSQVMLWRIQLDNLLASLLILQVFKDYLVSFNFQCMRWRWGRQELQNSFPLCLLSDSSPLSVPVRLGLIAPPVPTKRLSKQIPKHPLSSRPTPRFNNGYYFCIAPPFQPPSPFPNSISSPTTPNPNFTFSSFSTLIQDQLQSNYAFTFRYSFHSYLQFK